MQCHCSALVTLHMGKQRADITSAMKLYGFWEHREKKPTSASELIGTDTLTCY